MTGIKQERGEKIILDPYKHKEAARRFLDFYHLKAGSPGLIYLQEILESYTYLPYENISKIIKLNRHFSGPDRIRLPDEVMEEHAEFRLGGTCFSLTFFLQTILSNQGFRCYPVLASMRNRPNTHCALVVLLDRRKYLVDPGYLLTQPMEIHPDKPRLYRTPHTGVELRFSAEDEHYHLYTFDRDQVKWRYKFLDRPTPPDEFLRSWQASFYQPTMHGILLTRVKEDRLIYLHNDYLQITTIQGKQKRKLRENYFSTVRDVFGISAELVERAQEAMQRNLQMERELGIFKGRDGP